MKASFKLKKGFVVIIFVIGGNSICPPDPLATPALGADVVRQTQSAWFIQMINRVTTANVRDL